MRAGRARRAGGPDSPTPGSEADRTPDADPASVARAVLLRQLTMAPRTRAQLSQALARKGVPEEIGDAVLDRFVEVGLVDDAAFAQQWVTSRHEVRGLAPRALAKELRDRGVDDEVVREALERIEPEDEMAAARALVRRRLRVTQGEDPQRRYRRLAGMLARKGYGPGVALGAIRAELAVEADPAGEAEFDLQE